MRGVLEVMDSRGTGLRVGDEILVLAADGTGDRVRVVSIAENTITVEPVSWWHRALGWARRLRARFEIWRLR